MEFPLLTWAAAYAAILPGRTAGTALVSPSGEASYSIPLAFPAGVKGLAPVMSLTYGHLRGEASAGVGWLLTGLSAITRCGKTLARNGDNDHVLLSQFDAYCLDGSVLRLTSGAWMYGADGSTYRAEVNDGARIRANGSTGGTGPVWFKVHQKNGLIYEYGNSNESRIESLNGSYLDTPVIWALSKIIDRQGNEIVFNYEEDGAPNGEYRLISIDYTTNPGQGLTTAPYHVTFAYTKRSRPPTRMPVISPAVHTAMSSASARSRRAMRPRTR